ncbi:MAG: tetratricopeptide repeat protein [Arcobacteraceae bacterium]
MIRLSLNICFLLVLALHAETSMFGAGDLESAEPYGLTQTEEVIVKNKKIVAKNEKKLKKTTTKLQELTQRVDGIDSLLEGESIKLNKVFISLNKNIDDFKLFTQTSTTDINKNSEIVANMQIAIDSDIKKLKLQIDQNEENIKKLKISFDKIVGLVNDINGNYVTKKEFNKLIALLDKKQVEVKSSTKSTSVSSKSSKELLIEAKALFKKDYFTKAKPIFEGLISKNYRPAECNFYMGEIDYYRKNYKNALHYFKKSMTLYDKASYLPKLLLHSAISFENLGDSDNAQNFYSTIVDIYPNSNEAKEASKKIKQ